MKFTLEKVIAKTKGVKMTKRRLLSASASLYDLIGAIAPVTFALKTMFQRLSKDGGSWDDELNGDVQKEWNNWVTSAERCSVFEIPRCYDPNISESSQTMLIGFCDASEKGFAAVIYLRVKVGDGDELRVSTSLVAAKTRVAPLAKQTIPRLELLGCLILARLMNRIRNILHGR